MQRWQKGYKYIFLNEQAEVGKLVAYLQRSQADGIEAVSFIFAGDFDGKGQKPKSLLKIVVNVSGFTDGFKALEEACVRSR